jgi:uncharacterized protein
MVDKLLTIPSEFWTVVNDMAPYLLLGFLMAGVLSVLIPPEMVERHLGGKGLLPVFKAAALGVPLPLCSCGVIPVAAALRRHGASRGATVGFLISTPQTGADNILVVYSLLGLTFAIFSPIVAMVSGLIGGMAVSLLAGEEPEAGQKDEVCREACCDPVKAQGRTWGRKLGWALRYGFGTLPQDIGKPMLLGILVAAVISALVPAGFFAPILGGGVLAMVVMMLLSIPVYVCSSASVPVAAALIAKGVSPGVALVFLMTGPATNAAAIMTIWRVMGRRTALIYLASVAGTALAAGLTLDYIFHVQGVPGVPQMHMHHGGPLQWVFAIALLAVLTVAVVRSYVQAAGHHDKGGPHHDGHEEHEEHEMTTTLQITGMTCDHCRQAVQRALGQCKGVQSAAVDLAAGRATVTGPADLAELVKAVEGLGYQAKPAE